jgi:hypothetical protein
MRPRCSGTLWMESTRAGTRSLSHNSGVIGNAEGTLRWVPSFS